VAVQSVDSAVPSAQQAADLSHSIRAGVSVPVQLRSFVDSVILKTGFISTGVVTDDVKGTDGRTAIPAGSTVAILLRDVSKSGPISRVVMGLYAVNILQHQYSLSDGRTDVSTLTLTEDAGNGPAHSAIHLAYGYELAFTLDKDVQLR
jgi:hypothetical protein